MSKHLAGIENKPVILFTVSGAKAGSKLNSWIADSLPQTLNSRMEHVTLGCRMDPKKVGWWTRLILIIGAWKNDDPEARKHELEGFDFVDEAGIEPIKKWIQKFNLPPSGRVPE